MNNKPILIAGCLLENDKKFLMVQEAKPAAYGKWNTPAGHVDEGETLEKAALRETKEETGYDAMIDEKNGVYSLTTGHEIHIFQAHIVGGELSFPKDELLDAGWFTHEEIKAMDEQGQLRSSYIMLAVENYIATVS